MRAGDPRRMELLKDPTAAFSTSTGDARSYAYTDTTAVAARDYFYCVVAVALDQSGLELRSKPCSVRTGRAYDQQAPEPPVWLEDDIETLRVDASGQPDAGGELAVRLAFDAGDVAAVQIQKRARRATAWTGVFGWAAPPAEGAVLDRPVRAGEWFEYRIKCRSHGGIVSGQWSTTAVEIVED